MAGKTILILGGGWGGLAAAHHLRGLLPPEHRVVVVERKDSFSLCPSYLWTMTGERRYPGDVERGMSRLTPGIEWVHGEAQRIDPGARTVHLPSGALRGDYLVLAPGAELAPEGVPGFAGSAYNLYDGRGAFELQRALSEFSGGRVVVLISRTPFKCPPAPYEAAFLLDSMFRKRGIRDRTEVALYTPEKQPMPVAGSRVGAMLREMLEKRDIRYHPGRTVSRIDGASRRLHFDGGEEAPYDLLVGVPPHRAPRVVREAGLTDSTGYIPTHPQSLRILSDPATLETRLPGVFAIGDIAAIRLLNQALLPKAGVFAEEQGRVVAQQVAADIRGEPAGPLFNGRGVCYVEVGDGMAAYGSGNFYAYPEPHVALEPPSPEHRRAKGEFERVLDNWFIGS